MSEKSVEIGESTLNDILEEKIGKKKSTAQRRWQILAKALIGPQESVTMDAEDEISVRRFTSFDLLRVGRIESVAVDQDCAAWCEYSTVLENKLFTVEIRRIKKNFTANELIGFNNTGNICVWPSEECLAYYLLKNRQLCRNRRVLELGGGMSCLAGLIVAKYCNPKEIALTDGNVTSVNNVRRIIAKNGMADFVECGVVQWAKAARAIRAARSVRAFVHPHPNGLRVKKTGSIGLRVEQQTKVIDYKWADYWKSQGRKFCDFCKCWIADNKPSIDFHEGGKKHKENVSKRLKEIHKNSAKQAKQTKKIEDDIKKMENAAMIAYLKDVENNTRDMTADRIIKEKMTQIEAKDVSYFNHIATATSGAQFRFKVENQQFAQEIDPCDPTLARNITAQQMKFQHKGDSKNQGKSKAGKGKGKGKKFLEEERPVKPVQKLWYEALSPEGYTYYWHIENNESVWNPPEEGYMTFAEQQEEAKEQALQEELLQQLDKEEAIAKADVLEEKRANKEREKLKKLRKMSSAQPPQLEAEQNTKKEMEIGTEVESRPYRRDYSFPVKSHPYGPWQTVQKTEVKPLDFQLPRQNQPQVQLPVSQKTESQSSQRIFKEKTITQLDIPDINEDKQPITFKKRKISNRNVRQRLTDDS